MRIHLRRAVVAASLLAVGGIASGALAAPNDATPAAPAGMPGDMMSGAKASNGKPGHGMGGMGMGMADSRTMQQRVEQRITDLHAKLLVTAAEQPQWDKFAAVMRDNAQRMDASLVTDSGALAKMTAIEQMQAYAKLSAQHASDVGALVPAFQGLYDAMSPEQKLTADAYFRAQAQHMRHGKKG